jgi:hypothetical protein
MSKFASDLADAVKQDLFKSGIFGGIGNVYIVCNTANTSAFTELNRKFGGITYEDGSAILYPHTAVDATVSINGLQNALNSCVTSRNDYVIVMPSEADYDIATSLTMSKKAVHLVCPAGLGNRVGSTNAARIHQNAAYPIITLSQSSIEIAGFYLKNYAQYSGFYAATSVANVGVYGCNIHHNTFTMRSTTTAAQPMIYFNGDAGAWGSIESNWFITAVSNATYTSIIQIEASATSARVKYNEITIGDGCTASIGISNAAVKGVTEGNIICECGGSAVGSGGTVTVAVQIAASGNAIGNRCAVAAGQALNGGTAAHSFVDNMDGATGAGNGAASNLET